MICPIVVSLLAEIVPTWRNHFAGDGLGELIQFAFAALARLRINRSADERNCLLNAALQRHRIRAGSNRLDAFAINRLRQNGRRGGAVAGHVRSLGSDFLHHLRAHVFQGVAQFDFLGYGDAVLGNGRRAEFLVDDHVAALGAERDLYRVRQNIDAAQNRLSRLFSVNNLFCHCVFS